MPVGTQASPLKHPGSNSSSIPDSCARLLGTLRVSRHWFQWWSPCHSHLASWALAWHSATCCGSLKNESARDSFSISLPFRSYIYITLVFNKTNALCKSASFCFTSECCLVAGLWQSVYPLSLWLLGLCSPASCAVHEKACYSEPAFLKRFRRFLILFFFLSLQCNH